MSSSPDTTSSKSRLQQFDGQVGWHSSDSEQMPGQTENERKGNEVESRVHTYKQ